MGFKHRADQLIEKKSKLQSIENELIKEKQKNVKIHRAQIVTSREVKKVQDQLNHFKELREEYDYPEVSEFLNLQRQLQEVKKNYKNLCRRRKIQLFTLMKPSQWRQTIAAERSISF